MGGLAEVVPGYLLVPIPLVVHLDQILPSIALFLLNSLEHVAVFYFDPSLMPHGLLAGMLIDGLVHTHTDLVKGLFGIRTDRAHGIGVSDAHLSVRLT